MRNEFHVSRAHKFIALFFIAAPRLCLFVYLFYVIMYNGTESFRAKEAKKREAARLDTAEHSLDMKRMRTWSHDLGEDGDGKRRTRAVDVEEEKKLEISVSPEYWRLEHNITVQGHGATRNQEVPAPYLHFTEAPFSHSIQQTIKQAGFSAPTAIQSQAWPVAIQGSDAICIAKTGSGKTCGFLLPAFHQHLEARGSGNMRRPPAAMSRDPMLLVLAPTRELAVQIMEEVQRFGRPLGIRAICCYGGSSKMPQIAALERGVECIIATPGRLNDLLEMRKANLSNIKFVVLDEADRMLVSFRRFVESIALHFQETLSYPVAFKHNLRTWALSHRLGLF
jgi:ATP-dependent RNA helicase DDX5/DBP2